MPHTWWAFTPWPMAVALMLLITEPRATAVMLVCDRPPSNCTMSASMQRLAKIPSPRATNGGVWTTFGGATDTPRVTFRMGPLHEAAAWAGAAPAEKTTGSALAEGLASAAGLAAALPAGLAEALAEGLASAAALVEGLAEALDGGALAGAAAPPQALRRMSALENAPNLRSMYPSRLSGIGAHSTARLLAGGRDGPGSDLAFGQAQQRGKRDAQNAEHDYRYEHLVHPVGAGRAHDEIADPRDGRVQVGQDHADKASAYGQPEAGHDERQRAGQDDVAPQLALGAAEGAAD